MNTRQVAINLSDSQMIEIAEITGSWELPWNAIGYLSTWNMSYPYVTIFKDGENTADLVAVYKDVQGERKYVIGAVWHDGHYGFHS